jgi:hypothetical protein
MQPSGDKPPRIDDMPPHRYGNVRPCSRVARTPSHTHRTPLHRHCKVPQRVAHPGSWLAAPRCTLRHSHDPVECTAPSFSRPVHPDTHRNTSRTQQGRRRTPRCSRGISAPSVPGTARAQCSAWTASSLLLTWRAPSPRAKPEPHELLTSCRAFPRRIRTGPAVPFAHAPGTPVPSCTTAHRHPGTAGCAGCVVHGVLDFTDARFGFEQHTRLRLRRTTDAWPTQ